MDSLWTKHILLVTMLTSAGPGFVFHCSIVVSGQTCGEMSLISSPLKTNLSSPNFGSYEPNLNCFWTITASPGLAVELTITSFMLQDSTSCFADSVTIYNGASTSAEVLYGPECGSIIQWPVYPTTIVSTGNVMSVLFTTDDSYSQAGFQMTYREVSVREEFFLVVAYESGTIYKLNRLGQNYEMIVTGLSKPRGVDFDPVERKVYFTDGGFRTINRVNIDGSNHETIASVDVSTPIGLTVDHVSRFLYWADWVARTITRASLNGSDRTTLIATDPGQPRDIVVSIEHGYLFWTIKGSPWMIERSLKDGTEREVIVSTGLVYPYTFTLDANENKLYWADASYDRIERCQFDGSQRELIKQFQLDIHPFGLVVLKNAFVWSEWFTGKIHVSDRDFQHNRTTLHIGGATKLWGLAFHSSVNEADTDECTSDPCLNEGVCVDVENGYTCLCLPGFEGANCESDTDECASDPCLNEGVCVDVENGYTCLCLPGYEGAICESAQSTTDLLMCPESLSITTIQGATSVEVSYVTPNCTNSEGLVFDAICLPAAGRNFTVGVTEVGCVCADTGERLDECSFTVTVLDQPTSDPLMCPESLSITPIQGVTSVEVSYVTPNCTNDEGLVFDAICLPTPGRNFTVGVTEVGCVCTYTGERLDECSFTVTVLEPSNNQRTTWIMLSAAFVFLLLFIGTVTIVCCWKCLGKETAKPPKDIPMTNQSTSRTRPATQAYLEPNDCFSNRGFDPNKNPKYEKSLHITSSQNQNDYKNRNPNKESAYYIVQ